MLESVTVNLPNASTHCTARWFSALSAVPFTPPGAAAAAVCFWEIDANAVYTHVTPDVSGVLGYQPEQLIGKSFFDSLLPEAMDQILDWCVAARANQQSFFHFEAVHECCNGKLMTLETFGVALFNEKSEFQGYRGIHRDIGERVQLEQTFQKMLQRDRWMQSITRIRQSLNLRQILNTTIDEVRNLLRTDRVLLYRFEPTQTAPAQAANSVQAKLSRTLTGVIAAESVGEGWAPMLETVIETAYTSEHHIENYKQGEVTAIADIHDSYLEPWQRHLLGRCEVGALLIVPILQQEHLWGLLVAHHCTTSREWHPLEIEVLKQMAGETGIAIHQSECYRVLEETNRELHRLAHIDELTKVDNRRGFEEYLAQQWEMLARTQDSLALILCDVDHFKRYNDTYGHLEGDRCLTQVAEAIKKAVRRSADLVARYGGEEFAIILPSTKLAGALQVAKRVCAEMEAANLEHRASPISQQITLSLGVVSMTADRTIPLAHIISAADQALYRAKIQGRNRVAIGSMDFPNGLEVSAS